MVSLVLGLLTMCTMCRWDVQRGVAIKEIAWPQQETGVSDRHHRPILHARNVVYPDPQK
jgi:hypothetical protein